MRLIDESLREESVGRGGKWFRDDIVLAKNSMGFECELRWIKGLTGKLFGRKADLRGGRPD